jgi:hypothetical protein
MYRIRFITDVNGSMKELPGPKKERPWDKKWVVEALNVVPALGTAVVAALMAAADASRRPYFGILAGLAAALGMAFLHEGVAESRVGGMRWYFFLSSQRRTDDGRKRDWRTRSPIRGLCRGPGRRSG